ncbi:Regulatory protein BlaR1 [Pelotomaculum schinkii]|uniref:Regulatory protein BlaR1 n=1 Tax=Pelotomaculum schinkii TaxID=78350 RepID=A0A4Y7R885_9FIRM|nr:M56 family metallopeptidase [Pelotomaculum schinkii]TEB04903.1 Regulatory protein BlaR1 [Pelotomaculum schinkii]
MIKMLLMTSLTGSVISLLLILLKARLVKKFGGTWYYYICLLSLALFVVPVQVNVSGLMPQQVVIEERAPVQQAVLTGETASSVAETVPAAAAQTAVNHHLPLTVPDAEQWILGIWAAGVVFMVCRYLFGYSRFKKQVTQNSPVDKVENLAVVASDYVHSPMLIGFFKPKIVIPKAEISVYDYQLALRHELTHHTQKDAWFKLLAVLVNSLHWFNPLTYLVVRNISEACEYACDEKVTQGMEWEEKKRYSDMILNFAAQASPALSSSLARNKKQLFRRFELIMKTSTKSRKLLGTLLAAVMIAGSVTATSLVFAEELKPLSEFGGAFTTHYNWSRTLEDNVLSTLDMLSDIKGGIRWKVSSIPGTTYIDVNGRKIDTYNRTEPYYGVEKEWKEKKFAIETMTTKTLSIEGKDVTVAFSDKAAAYQDDKVIEKMIRNQITFELSYHDDHYDHQAFINELISRGAYVIDEVVTLENFKPVDFSGQNGDFLGMKILTKFDKKDKITDVFNQKTVIPKNIDGNQGAQLGNSFLIGSGESLAIDIKETTDKMPQVNLAIINVTTGELMDWIPGAIGGYRFIYTPREAYANHTFKVLMSGCKESDTASIEIFTYRTGDGEAASDGQTIRPTYNQA